MIYEFQQGPLAVVAAVGGYGVVAVAVKVADEMEEVSNESSAEIVDLACHIQV